MGGQRAGSSRPGRADLRLLGPAVLAWVAVAASLGIPAPVRGALAAVTLGLSALLGMSAVLGLSAPLRRGATVDVRRSGMLPALTLTLVLVGALLLASAVHGAARVECGLTGLVERGAVVRVEAMVGSDPRRLRPAPGSVRGAPSWLLTLSTTSVNVRGRSCPVTADLLVRGDERWSHLRWRESLTVLGRLAPMAPADRAVASLLPLEAPTLTAPAGVLARGAERAREGLREAVAPLPADARGLLPGLVLGDTSLTPVDLTEAMTTTGMTHLSAVSGSNVAIVLTLVLGLARFAGMPRRWRPVLSLAAVAGFVVLARPDPSVLRAAVMGSIGVLGVAWGRRSAGLPVLAGTTVVLLAWDPWLARSAGFTLSVLATIGLLVFARPWAAAIDARLPPRLPRLGELVAIPAAAYVMTAPVVLVLQGQVSLVSIVANALAAPLVAWATVTGVAAALVGVVAPGIAQVPAWLGAVPTQLIAWDARWFAGFSWGAVDWPSGSAGVVLLVLVLMTVVLTGRWWAAHAVRHPLAAAGLVVVLAGGFAPTRPVLWPPQGWQVVACDVGQGDAVVVRTGPDRALLVDAGPDPPRVVACLDGLGVRTLDGIVLTHFHADHVNGLDAVLSRWPVPVVLTSPVPEPGFGQAQVQRWAVDRGVRTEAVWAGDTLRFGEVTARVWWPARRMAVGSVPNNASVVLTLVTHGVSVLLLGDIEREAGAQVLTMLQQTSGAVPAGGFDVVKVAHHGSANADPRLMDWVDGAVALVSVGAGNDYGHPSATTMTALRREGYAVWRTDEHGSVAVVEGPSGLGVVGQR